MRTQLLGVRSMEDAISLFGALGYDRPAAPWDLGMAPMPNVERVATVQLGRRRRQGYALVFAETAEVPRSLRPLARSIRDQVHDRPLVVLGVTGPSGEWERMVVMRPQSVQVGGAVTVTKLDIDLQHPTQHDAEILNAIEWQLDEKAAHRSIDQAFDVAAVTDRFFRGLSEHYRHFVAAVQDAMDADPTVADRLRPLGSEPAERAALRILTQVLFTQFLQKKGFVEGRKDWLNHSYRTKTGPYYQTVLERLFYSGLGVPRGKRKVGDPDVPYLNGGLFDRFYGSVSLPLPDELFDTADGLLGYLSRWTFTVHEDMPDEAEVAVDPEMLGKVFEHLVGEESVEAHGTVYTPRPVVHFMCREALVPWLCDRLDLDETTSRLLLTEDDPLASDRFRDHVGEDRLHRLLADMDDALDDLHVIDPAVGSGAFLLGMLSEVLRLRTLRHRALNQGAEPGPQQVTAWKNDAIRRCLYGVDIESRAIELCRLRLWLSLLVDLPPGEEPEPLPNLEYRTVVANSLTDFASGVEIQNTRDDGGFTFFKEPELEDLHRCWYHAVGDERVRLDAEIRSIEKRVVEHQLSEAQQQAKSVGEREVLDEVRRRFLSPHREFPCFVPALHAPDVAARGGWDIVIMNPPYVGHKEARSRLDAVSVSDLERHHGDLRDLMVLFANRARQLVRTGGHVSMIFNDTIFTNSTAEEVRRKWFTEDRVLAAARTRCFDGRAITGGVLVVTCRPDDNDEDRQFRWVEGHKRPVSQFSEASIPLAAGLRPGVAQDVNDLEIFVANPSNFRRLPHMPLFRPHKEALRQLDAFERCAMWKGKWSKPGPTGWGLFENSRGLNSFVKEFAAAGYADQLASGDWVMLGTVIAGGQGLATADDKRFVAAIEGTALAARHMASQEKLEGKVLAQPDLRAVYETALHRGRETALLEVWDTFGKKSKFPKGGAFRVAPAREVRTTPLTADERRNGIKSGPTFVAFEKGDSSDTVDGRAMGAAWYRDNATVIDWSHKSVEMLRQRASQTGAKRAYFKNEELWFQPGVSLNKIARYIRPRLIPAGSVYGDGAPVYQPKVPWLSAEALCAIIFSDTVDFILRTMLSSLMNIQVGDIRRIPIPVLSESQRDALESLTAEAVEAKSAGDSEALAAVEKKVHLAVRRLYGVPEDADLWVVR